MLPATMDQKARGWSPFLRAIADQPTTLNGRSSGSTMGSAVGVLMAYNGQRSWWDGRRPARPHRACSGMPAGA